MAHSASPRIGLSACVLTRQGPHSQRRARTLCRSVRQPTQGVAWKLHGEAVRRVSGSSFVMCGRTASVEDGTQSHNLPQQAGA